MYHETHVGLVYAHAEGYSRDDHVYLLHQEGVLVLRTCLGIKSGVIWPGLYVIDAEQFRQFLYLLAAETVDYAGLAGVLLDVAYDVLLGVGLVPDLVEEVGAVERGLEDLRAGYAEILEYVVLDLGRGRGGQGNDRGAAYLLDKGTDPAVLRPEVVTPFRDAVGLVHSIEGDTYLLEYGDVILFCQ